MTTLILRRIQPPTEGATYGELFTEGGWKICLTMEEPWRANRRSMSCIPAGTYGMVKRMSPSRGYLVWELKDVPNRANIQIHRGNFLSDTEGCILVGLQHNDPGCPNVITDSKKAFRMLMAVTYEDEEGILEVVDP